MLSSVIINCQVPKIVMNSSSQLLVISVSDQCGKCHKSPGLSFQNCQKLSQFGGSQAKMRWSDVMGSGEVLNSTKKSIENPRITQ